MDAKILKKNIKSNLIKLILTLYTRSTLKHNPMKFNLVIQGWFNIRKAINTSGYINKYIEGEQMINSVHFVKKKLRVFNICSS